jgi:hypothetical protein
MPNHVTNIITIEGVSDERLAEILSAIRSDGVEGRNSIDFEKIIPPPPDMFRGNIGRKEEELYGNNTWLVFNTKNYGTKWNAYGFDGTPFHDGANQIEFMTAWNQPEPVIARLSQMFPDARFRHAWADEDVGANAGEILYQNGEQIEYDVPSRHSKPLLNCRRWARWLLFHTVDFLKSSAKN